MSRWIALAVITLLSAAGRDAAAQADPLAARSKGALSAPITVYEMSDFQCPYCKRHAEKTFPALEKEYIATGKARWIFINYPLTSLHSNALAAAEFAMCAAKQGKFWPAHDLLFRLQPSWAPLNSPEQFLLRLGDSLKLQSDKLTECLDKNETRGEVQGDAEGAVKAGATSTPTFYIEGSLLKGAFPPEIWRPILDSIYLAKTQKKP